MSPEQHREALAAQIARGDAPDGPVLDVFDALKMAQAIDYEINRAGAKGLPKITISFDLADAAAFAAFLRRAAIMGA